MVRALLAGQKSQTRRVMKHQPGKITPAGRPLFLEHGDNGRRVRPKCPYGHLGDRLWVRQTFRPCTSGEIKNGYGEVRYGFAYQADGQVIWNKETCLIHDLTGQPPTGPMQFNPGKWKPSIHMPRRASRILLEITDVRIEQLQDISEY